MRVQGQGGRVPEQSTVHDAELPGRMSTIRGKMLIYDQCYLVLSKSSPCYTTVREAKIAN